MPVGIRPGPEPAPHRGAWTLRTVAAILGNPRYTGRQVWNRQPSQAVLVDPANTGLGHKQVQRWNLPEGWVISRHPAHAALVSEADFIAAVPDPARPKSTYLREDQVLPHLAAIAILRAGSGIPGRARQAGITAPAQIADLIDQLRADEVVLTYDPQDRTLRADGHDTLPVTVGKNR